MKHLALLPVLALALAACSEAPIIPSAPESQPEMILEKPVAPRPMPGELLDDPLVQLLVTNLEDPVAAKSVRSSLSAYRAALDGQDRAPAALKKAQSVVARATGSGLSPDDEIALAVLGLVLDAEARETGVQ